MSDNEKYEFWAFRHRPRVLKGEKIIFTFDKRPVAEALCSSIEPPGKSKCTATGKYEDYWKVFFRDFKKYKSAADESHPHYPQIEELLNQVYPHLKGEQRKQKAKELLEQHVNNNARVASGTINGEQVLQYMMKLNHWRKDIALQVLGVDGYGSDFVLKDYPLSKLRAGDDYMPGRAEQYAALPTPFPPIVLGYEFNWSTRKQKLVIKDGNHRVAAAKRRGDKTIKAYVQVDDKEPSDYTPSRKSPGTPTGGWNSSLAKTAKKYGQMYHGTGYVIDKFDTKFNDRGLIFFTPDKSLAESFSLDNPVPHVYECTVDCDNVFNPRDPEHQKVLMDKMGDKLESRSGFFTTREKVVADLEDAGYDHLEPLTGEIKAAGFDGVWMVENMGEFDTLAVFSPEKITIDNVERPEARLTQEFIEYVNDKGYTTTDVNNDSELYERLHLEFDKQGSVKTASAYQPSKDTAKLYKVLDWEYWHDPTTRLWWATQHDTEGNQIGDALNAYTKEELRMQMSFLRYPETDAYKDQIRRRVKYAAGEAWRGAQDPMGNESNDARTEWYLEMLDRKIGEARKMLLHEFDSLEQKRLADSIETFSILRENMANTGAINPFKSALLKNAADLWHGGKIYGPVDIQAPTKGRYEAGPGLYLTTSYWRAQSYAKGGKSTFLVSIKDNINWADNVEIPLAEGVEFATRYLGKGKLIAKDLKSNCERMNKDVFTADILINLTVNYEAGSGQKGMYLLRFLVDHGVDAALENKGNNEQWVVVFNPAVVTKVRQVPAKEVTSEMWEQPKVGSADKVASPDYGYSEFNNRDVDLAKVTWETKRTSAGRRDIYAYFEGEKIAHMWIGRWIHRVAEVGTVDDIASPWVGTGLGQQLYDHAIQAAKEWGCTHFMSDDDDRMSDAAIRAWQRLSNRYPVMKIHGKFVIDFRSKTASVKKKDITILYLDDCRVPNDPNIDVVHNYNEFVAYFNSHEMPNIISFDHDIDLEHCPTRAQSELRDGTWKVPYEDYKVPTGLECAKWLVEHNMPVRGWQVHSANPVGADNIRKVMKAKWPKGEVYFPIPHRNDEDAVYGGKVKNGFRVNDPKTASWEKHIPRDIMETYSYGYCTRLAMVLNRRFGWPIIVGYEGTPADMYIKHAWVRLPDGRDLDICGFEGPADFEPFLEERRMNDWQELGDIVGAQDADLAEAEDVMNKYVIPTYLKDMKTASALPELPPEPGTLPIPPMTVRFFHYTKSYDNLPSIKAQGLLGSMGRGDGGTGSGEASAGVWASTVAPDNYKLFVEFYAGVDQISHRAQYPEGKWDYDANGKWGKQPITQAELTEWASGNKHAIMQDDIPLSQFLAIHEPWHHHARYLLEMTDAEWAELPALSDPAEVEKLRTVYNSPEEAKALAYVQQVKGITKSNLGLETRQSDAPLAQ